MYLKFYFVIRGNNRLRECLQSVGEEWQDLAETQIWGTRTSTRGMNDDEIELVALQKVQEVFVTYYRNDLIFPDEPLPHPFAVFRQSLAVSPPDKVFDEWWEVISATTVCVDADSVNKPIDEREGRLGATQRIFVLTEQIRFVNQLVDSGSYPSQDAVIQDALELLLAKHHSS